jgi:hypothetical protein
MTVPEAMIAFCIDPQRHGIPVMNSRDARSGEVIE